MTLFFFAGEQSGDLLGAELISADHHCVGVGGPLMQEKGLKPLFDFNAFQVMGFTSILPALPRIFLLFHKIKKWILQNNPKAVILIDYAEFNLHLAKHLRKKGYHGKIIQYVCPSVWAWRKNRIHTLEENLDHLLCILPFETKLFKKLPTSYVGHPLTRKILRHSYSKTYEHIALFPGSRRHEVSANLPLQLAAAKEFSCPIAISVANPALEPLIRRLAPDTLLVPTEYRYDLMRSAKGAIATSGTVVLELGLHQTPTVVTYPLSFFNYFLAKYIFRIRLPFYTLVNLIANREIYPEFIHRKLDSKEIASALQKVMQNPLSFRMDEEPFEILLDLNKIIN